MHLGGFYDLSKAFDLKNHDILLLNLTNSVLGVVNASSEDYLSNTSLYVDIENSSRKHMPCGIPQGSILGHLPVLVYINDINILISYPLT